jgi:hypothetical protein
MQKVQKVLGDGAAQPHRGDQRNLEINPKPYGPEARYQTSKAEAGKSGRQERGPNDTKDQQRAEDGRRATPYGPGARYQTSKAEAGNAVWRENARRHPLPAPSHTRPKAVPSARWAKPRCATRFKNGNFKTGDWTAEALHERKWLRSLVKSFAKTVRTKRREPRVLYPGPSSAVRQSASGSAGLMRGYHDFFAAREKGRLSDRTLAALEAYSAMDARRRGRSRMRGNG